MNNRQTRAILNAGIGASEISLGISIDYMPSMAEECHSICHHNGLLNL
jgi:hypothetical protein